MSEPHINGKTLCESSPYSWLINKLNPHKFNKHAFICTHCHTQVYPYNVAKCLSTENQPLENFSLYIIIISHERYLDPSTSLFLTFSVPLPTLFHAPCIHVYFYLYSPYISWWFDYSLWIITVSLTFTITSEVADDELLPSLDTALFKCFGIDWAELCDMWVEVYDETCESSARMLVTVEGCKGGTGAGWSYSWRAVSTSGTPV